METVGRGYSEFHRNTSEDLFFKSLMENSSTGMPAPAGMEMLGFKNLSNSFRTDSEELFKSWLTNGENHGYNSPSIGHRSRNVSRRISTELASLMNSQSGGVLKNKGCNESFPKSTHAADVQTSDLNHNSLRNAADKGLQASNLFLAKAWLHSSQPMTRSRSSELRRRYVAMQNSQTQFGMEAIHDVTGHNSVNNSKQELEINPNPNGFWNTSFCDIPDQFSSFMSPTNSCSSTFNTAAKIDNVDKISSVVSMLKGTLERKKLTNLIGRETSDESSLEHYFAQEDLGKTSLNIQGQGNYFIHETPRMFKDPAGALQSINGSFAMEFEGFVTPPSNPMPTMSILSRETSKSESSAATVVVVSTGYEAACDGSTNSGQTVSQSSTKQLGNEKSSENGSMAKDIRERIYDNIKDVRKRKGSLVQYGSTNTIGSVDKGDPTKKRRVERSRKMAEAKERNLTPSIPSDMQCILKRCDNLEKEVRSLKLNLSFMNRKDSEQTKQIEELQKQNNELTEEKERLLEEIDMIIGQTGNTCMRP